MLWNVLAARDNPGAATAQSLRNMRYGYDVNYEGDGEILRVTDTPKEGSREVDFDVASGFIQNEKVTDFPSGYVVTRWGGADKKKIALTFDDGPDSKYTPKILSILKYFGVPATFFVTGANANVHPNILRSIVAQGSEIGNHTYTHPNLTMISSEQFHVELDATERLFEGFLGRKSLLFRPPYAEDIEPVTPDQVAPLESIDSLGYYTVGMHIDPGDWNRPGTDKIVADVLSEARSGVGNIVLLHDGGGNRDETVAALPRIIQGLQTSGFQLVTVSGLLGLPPESVMPPVGASERTLALTYEAAFFLVTGFNYFLQAMFFLGIVLGSARFLLVGVLAVAQRIRVSFWRHRRPMTKFVSQVAVIVPAHNEEVVIARTILSILVSEYSRMHVVVVDDGSTDRTLEILKEEFGNDSRVTIVTQENTGKAGALNHGIQYTDDTDEVIVTLDADTMFRSDTVGKLVGRFADQRIGAVAGNAKVGNRLNILTRWQALEYITSQNLDRRAFEMINCITVVPGSVGAWRRSAILEVGGFSNDTLAEDADLTFSVLRDGWHIAYEDEALAYTEAPDTVKNFIKQRFRWMFGTLQTAWKHRDTLFLPRYGALGFFAIPNIFIFQIFFPLISPLMDLMLVSSLIWAAWQKYQHPLGYSFGPTIDGIVTYYLLFLAIDLLTGILPFFFERREQWWLIVFLPLQRFFYRQLMYYVAIKVMLAALRGKLARWGKFERRATVGMRI
jgi:cellulose synthase/poly-beta-1,6-N-acetylglucosamine synthase-like glycosyltransferase/peptidoglycan/xylan/chitin deacetylase (PgdA/CDA1 family)